MKLHDVDRFDLVYCGMRSSERLTLIINVGFHHPDPEIARKAADFIAQEYLEFTSEIQAANKWSRIALRSLSSAGPARLIQVDKRFN